MIKVSALYIYPIKSLGGIAINSMSFDELGPKFDRRFMLIDEQGNMLTAREHPVLAKFKTELSNNILKVSFDHDQIQFDINQIQPNTHTCHIWEDIQSGHEINNDISKWFSKILDFKVKLVKFNLQQPRVMDKKYAKQTGLVGFADGFQILLTQQSSLEALELKENEDMLRFRPNIVVEGDLAFSEDFWRKISINDNDFEIIKPCSRCNMPAVNPIDASKQPKVIKALAQKRLFNKEIYFGQNVVMTQKLKNPINIDQQVYVIEKSTSSNIT